MKKLMFLIVISVMAFMISCSDEQPTKINDVERVLQIKHRIYKGECLGYCDTELNIDSLNVVYTQRGWAESKILPQKDSSFSISLEQINRFYSSFNIDNVFALDTLYQPLDEIDNGYITLEITTDLRHKKIQFNTQKYLQPVDSLNKLLMELRKNL
jgi:hypothetical protein